LQSIPSPGGSLFEAAVAQGIAGMLARQRSSPYLPGCDRLWRYVAPEAGEGDAGVEIRAAAAPV
jgi:hypothetical protein